MIPASKAVQGPLPSLETSLALIQQEIAGSWGMMKIRCQGQMEALFCGGKQRDTSVAYAI